jgi:BirA family biotin operon repressor/biotin-[acetyl-CoA-carboxylase] ligase
VFSDLDRPGLRVRDLRRALLTPGSVWTDVQVVDQTGSTNADLVAAAARGAASGTVLAAELQTGGRGRQDRSWVAPPRSGLTFSVLLRPASVPAGRWGWFPLLAGLAVAEPLHRLGGLDVRLKWPNDVLVGERKLAGILAERAGDALVIGIGINVSLRAEELPVETATSLAIEESEVTDRDPVLRAVLRALADRYEAFCELAGADEQLVEDYRAACATLGRDVRVALPGGVMLEGTAVDIDADGRLLVETGAGREAVGAGDVLHVR